MISKGYIDFVLANAPRVITQIDRDPISKTYGSCDRNHWHLKIRDFDSAILQQSGLVLALLYELNFEGNTYFQNPNVKAWAQATVDYWAEIQLKDGSYNEYYPHEHGFPPTAFSLYAMCEVYKRIGMESTSIQRKMIRAARWLGDRIETQACNQEMASITALYSAYGILKEEWLREKCEAKFVRFLSMQSTEGWFPEYGGADIGYSSVTLDMLGEYYRLSGDARVILPLKKLSGFLSHFIQPNQTAGGEYGSRNTTYFLPGGLEAAIDLGARSSEEIKRQLFLTPKRIGYFLDSVDDRYFSHYLLHSFLRAIEYEQRRKMQVRLSERLNQLPPICYFENAGLLVYRNSKYSAFVGMAKGGVIKIFDDSKELFVNCGYRVDYGKGVVATTNWQDAGYKYSFDGNTAIVKGLLSKVNQKVSKPILHMGLRVISFFVGSRIISYLKRKLIFVENHTDIEFTRTIQFADDAIAVKDILAAPRSVQFRRAGNMSLRHVASGKFFADSDLIAKEDRIATPTCRLDIVTEYDVRQKLVREQVLTDV